MAAIANYDSVLTKVRQEIKPLIKQWFTQNQIELLKKEHYSNDIVKIVGLIGQDTSIQDLYDCILSEGKQKIFESTVENSQNVDEKVENCVLKLLMITTNEKRFDSTLRGVLRTIQSLPNESLNAEVTKKDLVEDIQKGQASKLRVAGILDQKSTLDLPCQRLQTLAQSKPIQSLSHAVRSPLSSFRGSFNMTIRTLYDNPATRADAVILDFLVEDGAYIDAYYNAASCSIM